MRLVKVKTILGSEIFINLDRIDCISPVRSTLNFSNYSVALNDESMKKVMDLIEREGLRKRESE